MIMVRAFIPFSFKNNILDKTLWPANTARGIKYKYITLIEDRFFQTSSASIITNAIPNISPHAQPSISLSLGEIQEIFYLKTQLLMVNQ